MASGSWLLTTGGAWNNNANWSAAFPNALTDTATIATNLTADETITLGQAISVGSMTFSDNGAAGNAWTIAPGGAFALTLGTSTITTTTNATISASVAGSAAVTKAGAGTLTLSGGGTNTGAWAVNAGTLAVTTAALTGTSGVITVASGATLTSDASGSIAKPITSDSGSIVSLLGASTGTLLINNRSFTLAGSATSTTPGVSVQVAYSVAGAIAALTLDSSRILTSGFNTLVGGNTGSVGAVHQIGASTNFTPSNQSGVAGFYIGTYTSTNGYGYYLGKAGTLTFGSGMTRPGFTQGAGVVELSGVTVTSPSGNRIDVFLGATAAINQDNLFLLSSGTPSLNDLYLNYNSSATTARASCVIKGTGTGTFTGLFFAGATGTYSGDTRVQGNLVITEGRSASFTSIGNPAVYYASVHLKDGSKFILTGATSAPTNQRAKLILYGNSNKIGGGAGSGGILGLDITDASGQGLASVTGTSGAGYVGPPNVRIERGVGDTTGYGAVVSATYDHTTRTVTGYVVESPGVGYTVDPIVTLSGGGPTSAATISAVSRAANSTDGNVIKEDSGTLTLTGINTNTGAYTVSAGTLRIGNAGTTGTLGNNDTSNASVASGATLAFGRSDARTYSGIISGAGTIAVNGGARATLSGVNTFTSAAAAIAISTANSALRVTNSDSIGQGTAFGITVASGTAFEIDGTSGNITGLPAKALSLTGTGITAGGALRNIAGSNTYPGTITMIASSRINSDAGTLTLSSGSPITGNTFGLTFGGAGDVSVTPAINTTTGTITKDGAGFTDLRGVSSYTGVTTVSAGTLGYATAAAAGSASSFGQPAAGANAIVGVAGNAVAASAGGIRFTGTADQTFSRTVNITGTNAAGLAVRIEAASNTAKVTHSAAFTNTTTNQPRTYQFGGTGTTLNTVSFLVANNGTGAVGITKADAGRWVLSNTGNTYTGATAVNAGTLGLSVATWSVGAKVTSTSTVTVNAGAKIQTFAGSGGSAQNGRHTYSNLTFAANGRIRIGG